MGAIERVLPREQNVNTPDIKDVKEIVKESAKGGSNVLYLHKLKITFNDFTTFNKTGFLLLHSSSNTPITKEALFDKDSVYMGSIQAGELQLFIPKVIIDNTYGSTLSLLLQRIDEDPVKFTGFILQQDTSSIASVTEECQYNNVTVVDTVVAL